MRPHAYAERSDPMPRPVPPAEAGHRRALVQRMISGAVLPRLLARKDAGAFDARNGTRPAERSGQE